MAVPRWLKHPALLAPVAIGAIVLAAFLFIRYMDQRAANHAEDVEAIKAKIPAFFAKTVAGLELEGPDLAPERVYHPVLPIRVDDDRAGSLQSNLVHRLPGDLLAGTLEETSTLVLSINNIKNVIAMVDWDVTIVLVDVGRRRVVGRKRFQGEVPPSRTTYEYMGKMSDRFWGPIADWIESVTRR